MVVGEVGRNCRMEGLHRVTEVSGGGYFIEEVYCLQILG